MSDIPIATGNHQYAVDGGSVMCRIWSNDKIYGEIVEHCSDVVLAKPFMEIYGKAIVAFDSYDRKTSTKDITHMRHARKERLKYSPRKMSFFIRAILSLSKKLLLPFWS